MRGVATRAVLFLLLAGGLAACRGGQGPEAAFDVDLSVSPTPPAVGPARLVIRISEPGEEVPIPGMSVQVEGLMTHPGMNPVTAAANATEDGRYRVDAFEFTMAGDWIVVVSASHPDGRSVRAEFPMRAVAPAPPRGPR
jgi:hypothetical protein